MSTSIVEPARQAEAFANPTALELEAFYTRPAEEVLEDIRLPVAHEALLRGLESGELRAARPTAKGWRAVSWLKSAILLGFRAFPTVEMAGSGALAMQGSGIQVPAFDRAAYPPRQLLMQDEVRWVPGGSTARRGAHLAPGVVVMPPSYINVGAWVGAGTMVDSHVLVGSCAQVGKGVHLSAGVQVGGVLEPPGSCPVVIEDGAFLGAQVGVFEGIVIGAGAVLAPGTHLTASTRIYDLCHERTWVGRVPPGAVVVPGGRPAAGTWAEGQGLTLYAPVIVKVRDGSTDAATALEEALR